MLKETNFARRISDRAGEIFSLIPISPNQWTALSLVFAALGALELFGGKALTGGVMFGVSFFCDFVDGAVARKKGEVNPLGAYFDGMSDRVSEFLLLFGLLFYPIPTMIFPSCVWIFLVLFFGTCMTSYAKAYADHRKVLSKNEIEKTSSLFGRAERVSVLLLSVLALELDRNFSGYLLVLTAVLSFLTVGRIFRTVVGRAKNSKNR
ncbi:MAG: CDP-alcohol phosphatidyltransferase family protein [Candidatus Anstonellales archaeon]